MQISKKTQYGLRAMIYLAKNYNNKKICPLSEISEKENISYDFLEKIISELESAGLVKARRGVKGGYFLSKDPKNIKVGEIIRVLEATIPVSCFGCFKAEFCGAKIFWDDLKKSLDSAFNSKTLKDLINNKKL